MTSARCLRARRARGRLRRRRRALPQHGHASAPGRSRCPCRSASTPSCPAHLDVVPGDTVTWTNDSVRGHTITADDGSFDSGRVVSGTSFGRALRRRPGRSPTTASLHPFIRGVGRRSIRFCCAAPDRRRGARPRVPADRSRQRCLPGRPVTIEADRGAGFAPVATTSVAGRRARSRPASSRARRRPTARSPRDAASPAVTLIVLDRRISLRVAARRAAGRSSARASPRPQPGRSVVLQLYLRERFGWWPVQRSTLDRSSSARFALRLRRRVAARVLLTLPDGATPLAISRTVRLGSRPARGHRPH